MGRKLAYVIKSYFRHRKRRVNYRNLVLPFHNIVYSARDGSILSASLLRGHTNDILPLIRRPNKHYANVLTITFWGVSAGIVLFDSPNASLSNVFMGGRTNTLRKNDENEKLYSSISHLSNECCPSLFEIIAA